MAVSGNQGFSIVMCCFNSEERLPASLNHIAQLEIPPGMQCELIVINNASTDNTYQTVLQEWSKYQTQISFRIVDEPLPGLSNARKKGFEEARYHYVLWCDDDNWLNTDYLLVANNVFNTQERIGVIGGYGQFFSDSGSPEWLRFSQPFFAIGPQGEKSGPVGDKRVYGAGAVIYKPAYEKIVSAGFRQLLTDRLGNNLASGGDYEICYAISLAGYTIWYEEDLKFTHCFPSFRLTHAYYLKLIKESVLCLTTLDAYSIVMNKKTGSINFSYFVYIGRHLSYFYKQIIGLSLKAVNADKNTGYGFFIRSKISFFVTRQRDVLANLPTIYRNTKRIYQFRTRIQN